MDYQLPPPPPAIHGPAVAGASEEEIPAGLEAISIVESSGGQNLDHPVITNPKSMHLGMRAGGSYAVMPLTFKDVVRRHPHLRERYASLLERSAQEITNILNADPKISRDVALAYYRELSSTFKGDHVKVAHAWLHGPGNTVKRTAQEIADHPYVKTYVRAYTEISRARAKRNQRAAFASPPPPVEFIRCLSKPPTTTLPLIPALMETKTWSRATGTSSSRTTSPSTRARGFLSTIICTRRFGRFDTRARSSRTRSFFT